MLFIFEIFRNKVNVKYIFVDNYYVFLDKDI